ncbi:hypothetical protein GCM10010302_47710 [Streptomyces polychromogenes]|uniref:Uncharacterized protein n=1 Tax=Streptomyces polychromogenes TaxID=67342 RepID=A0ABP3F509_9ACTN
MTKLAWTARGIAAVSGAVLLGSLMTPSAAAAGGAAEERKCSVARDFSLASPDDVLPTIVFRVATDRQGHAFLNDTRNPGVWINLGLLDHAPKCVVDTAVAVGPNRALKIDLLARNGVIHHTSCVINTSVPYTPANLPSFCGVGFSPVGGTPV